MRLSLSTYGTHRIRQNTAPPKVVRAFIDGEKSGEKDSGGEQGLVRVLGQE